MVSITDNHVIICLKVKTMAKPNIRSIKLYTLSTCHLCKWLKKRLGEMGHEFEAVDVDLLKSGEQWIATKEVKRCNPEATYPTMIVPQK